MVEKRKRNGIGCGRGHRAPAELGVGSAVELEIGLEQYARSRWAQSTVPMVRTWAGRVEFVLPSGELKDQPSTWYGGVHMDPKLVATMERGLFAAYPTVTIINVADVLERIESVVDQITFVVRLLAGFSILRRIDDSGLKHCEHPFRRMQEAVVLKTLGATRMRNRADISVWSSACWPSRRAVGVVFANLLTRVLLLRLEVAFNIDLGSNCNCACRHRSPGYATGWIAKLSDSWFASIAGAPGRVKKGREQSRAWFDHGRESTYDEQVGFSNLAPCRC